MKSTRTVWPGRDTTYIGLLAKDSDVITIEQNTNQVRAWGYEQG